MGSDCEGVEGPVQLLQALRKECNNQVIRPLVLSQCGLLVLRTSWDQKYLHHDQQRVPHWRVGPKPHRAVTHVAPGHDARGLRWIPGGVQTSGQRQDQHGGDQKCHRIQPKDRTCPNQRGDSTRNTGTEHTKDFKGCTRERDRLTLLFFAGHERYRRLIGRGKKRGQCVQL